MEKLLTTKELAEVIGASESSLRRWTDSGAIRTSRTVGGHRRIPLSEAVRFIRDSKATIIRPDLLGLPEVTPKADAEGAKAVEEAIYRALHEGESIRARGQILGLYLGGATLAAIFDGPIGRSMHKIGELWEHDARGILIEHRAADICLQAIGQLRQLLSPVHPAAPATVGGSPPGDPYLLPSIMAATILAEAGYRETNFGPDTPFEVLAIAAHEQRANPVWLSVSTISHKAQLQHGVEELSRRLLEQNSNLIIGGRHAAAVQTHGLPNVHVLKTMSELAAFVRGLKPIKPIGSAN